MHHLYVRLCKQLNINRHYFIGKLKCIYKAGKYDRFEIFKTTITSQNDALWVEIHEKSREATLRGK